MSDEEDTWMESEEDGDFSVSEEEWLPEPTKDKKGVAAPNETMDTESDMSEDEEIADSETDAESDSGTPIKMTRKQAAKRGLSKKSPGNASQGVRKLFSKYKPVPVQAAQSGSSSGGNAIPTSLSDLLKRSKFRSKKLNSSQSDSQASTSTGSQTVIEKKADDDDESSSSGDEHLVPADQINLNSDFFNIQPKKTPEITPDFDCNAGIDKSDESGSESEPDFNGFSNESISRAADQITNKKKTSRVVAHINEKSSNIVDLQVLGRFNQNLEAAKEKLKGFQSKSFAQEEVNVSQLLAMGEETALEEETSSKKASSKKSKGSKRKHEESGSDWEEVEDESDTQDEPVRNKDLQITVELPGEIRKRTNKEVDIEAQIKRKLNSIKKVNQVYMHKVHLLCWIAYGNRINRVLNSPNLYKTSLKTLPTPSKQCYPKDKTDIKYYEQISTWYRQEYVLTSQTTYPVLKKLPPLETSLSLQISGKQMICKRDYCMAFVVLLRAMGFQCRLVMSLVSVPLKPPQSELCSLSKIDKSKMYKGYKKSEENGSENEKTTLDELKKGRKAPEIKEDPKVVKKRKAVDDGKNKAKKSKRGEEPKIVQMDGADDTPPKTRNRSKRTVVPNTDSPFKKMSKGNSNTAIAKAPLEEFVSPVKPKIKRVSEVPTLNDSVEPSPLKTRKQRLLDGSKPKMPSTSLVQRVTKKLSAISNDKPSTSPNTQSILKPSTSSISLKIISNPSRKSVTFRESPKPSTSSTKDPSPRVNKSNGPRGHQNKKQKIMIPSSDDDDLFEPTIILPKMPPKPVNKRLEQMKKIDRRVLSSDDDTPTKAPNKKKNVNVWVEVYAEKEKRWVTVDLFKGKVDCVDLICQSATSPITYVVAWNNDNTIKDVSPRYCEHWNTITRKMRVEKEWWDETILPFLGKIVNERDKAENKYFDKIHSAKPMPTAISDFKNHPLYALERHLLKFEAMYPPDAPPIGWIRKEAVYPRDCVYTLLTREKWVKEARVVKINEEPYKIVTSPKWDRFTQKILKNCLVELFGIWQTKPYEPPTAENGIVPRNEYGNVELFKECMLPKKTVHLKFVGLNKVCKKLGIDCAPAIVGFDFHNGWSHPVYDGFVVCEEFQETVTDAWIEEQDELERKDREKIEKRVYGNWRKLIKGLLIRKRLQARYNFEGDDDEEDEDAPVVNDDAAKKGDEKVRKAKKK